MSQIHVEVSDVINASPQAIYGVISDYKVGHPAIVPKPYFQELIVEQGGQGAGTIVLTKMEVMGVKVNYRLTVTEPEPGRVLREVDEQAGVDTRFTVDPLNDGQQSRVTITTDSKTSPGFKGLMEKLMNPPVMRRIYRAELEQLAHYVQSKR